MNAKSDQSARALIVKDFGLTEAEGQLSEEELLDILADHIGEMLEKKPDFLFSLLYRVDVIEPIVRSALAPENPLPGNVALARAVWERQRERAWTREKFSPKGKVDFDQGGW